MGQLRKKWIAGNLVYWDTHEKRLIDAIGADVFKYQQDFVNSGLSAAEALVGHTVTLVEGGGGETTIAATDALGGALLITTDANENDGANIQVTGESFKLSSACRALYFGTRLQISDATQSDIFVGLSIASTDILAGVTDSLGFRKVDGSTTLSSLTEKDSNETTNSALTVVAATNYILEFYFDGTAVEFFVDGVSTARHTATIPDDEELSISIHFLTGSANARTCQIDWIRAVQIGRG